MPVVNMALQNQAYCGKTMSHEMEYKFKKAGSGKGIRNVTNGEIDENKKTRNFETWKQSMLEVKLEINKRFSRISYCGSRIKVVHPAKAEEIEEAFKFI